MITPLGKSKSLLKKAYCHITRSRDKNIYHCTIQRSASQWFLRLFQEPLIWRYTHLLVHNPRMNFIPRTHDVLKTLQSPVLTGAIISPFYIRYEDFKTLPKPQNYRAFYVMRDPRDLMISSYFSLKYTHPPYDPFIVKMRERLHAIPEDEGLLYIIKNASGTWFSTLQGWMRSVENQNIKIFRFEDIFFEKKEETLRILFQHCEIDMPDKAFYELLDKYSFENITGRPSGTVDLTSHYRSGIKGGWKNYFSKKHKSIFKEYSGSLLIDLGYEKDMNW